MPEPKKLNILIIDEEFPYPQDTGKCIRSFNLARGICDTHRVSYLAYGDSASEAFKYMQNQGMTPHTVPPVDRRKTGWRFYCRLLANLFSRYPYIVTSHYSRLFRNKVLELAKSGFYDIVICEWTPYAIFIKDIPKLKKIIVAHNIESSIWARYEANASNPLTRLYISIQRKKIEAFERRCFSWANGATAVCKKDAEVIKGFRVSCPVEIIENGVDVSYFKPWHQPADGNMIVFTGAMDWRPNQDAATYFVNEILPLIRQRRPLVKLAFVGRQPPKHILKLAKIPGVAVTGTVDDVRPYIAKAALCIVPLRIGGGSRLKILEAMAMEKPVVSTSIGAEGLQVRDGKNILIADSPEDFAKAVLICLDDVDLRKSLAIQGRRLVETNYRWEDQAKKLSNYINEIAHSS